MFVCLSPGADCWTAITEPFHLQLLEFRFGAKVQKAGTSVLEKTVQQRCATTALLQPGAIGTT